METIYIIGAGAIGKVLAVCLNAGGRNAVLLRGSVDDGETHQENIKVALPDEGMIEALVTISTLSNFARLEGIVVLTNKSYGNAGLAVALKNKINGSPLVILQNGLGVEQVFIDGNFPAIYRCVLFATSQPVSATQLNFKPVAVSPIGPVKGGDDVTLDKIAGALNTGHFGFRAENDIQPIIWKKAIVNSVFNSVCPLLDVDNGIFHRNEQALKIAESIIAECLAVAHLNGVILNMEAIMDSLLLISRSSDGQFISTLQDIRNQRPTEIATLNEAIAGMARAYGHEGDVIRTSLLGQLTMLKSEINRPV